MTGTGTHISVATPSCKGCSATVRLAPGEVERILSAYLRENPGPLVADAEYARRLEVCDTCPDLQYGTTCRHCGCLVAVRGKLAEKGCPGPVDRWATEV